MNIYLLKFTILAWSVTSTISGLPQKINEQTERKKAVFLGDTAVYKEVC